MDTASWNSPNASLASFPATNRPMPAAGRQRISVGVQNHGQGHETTLAQIAAHEPGIDPEQISVRYGDTAIGPYGFGTFASRSTVFAGGAVAKAARALAAKILRISTTCCRPMSSTRIADGMVRAVGNSRLSRDCLCRQRSSGPVPTGMEFIAGGNRHLQDRQLRRRIRLRHASGCGGESGQRRDRAARLRRIRGLRHDDQSNDQRQVQGGIAQGIGTALYEIAYDEAGQPLATTFADYVVPCAPETVRIEHLVTPALTTASKVSAKAAPLRSLRVSMRRRSRHGAFPKQ